MNDITKFILVWFVLPGIVLGAVATLGRWLVANNVPASSAAITAPATPVENPHVQTGVNPGSGVTVQRYTREPKPE